MLRVSNLLALAVALVFAVACGDGGPLAPNLPAEDVAGSYRLSTLTFDPQGSLPATDVLARLKALGKPDPSLTLLVDGSMQLLFEDPSNGLLRLVDGSFLTTPTGVEVDFGSNPAFRALLLSRQMPLTRDASGNLVFEGDPPGGLPQVDLIRLVTEWSNEPLTNPVPGVLRVGFAPIS